MVENFYYDETSPSCLRWNITIYAAKNYSAVCVRKGDVAGTLDNKYYRVKTDEGFIAVHRIIWRLFNGEIPDDLVIDHIDRNPSNNKISNLRLVTELVNNRNRNKSESNKSGTTGVHIIHTNFGGAWRAAYTLLDGSRVIKSFSVAKYGYDKAREMAEKVREEGITQLNTDGAGYTETHGV